MDDIKVERIICSAIWYDNGKEYVHSPVNIKTGFVVAGLGHHNCLGTVATLTGFNKQVDSKEAIQYIDDVQGFLTNKRRFVERIEAMNIAIASGQVVESELNNPRIGLFSEDFIYK